jgi:hypothetical protein
MGNLQILQILTTNTHLRVAVHTVQGYIPVDRETFISRLKVGYYVRSIPFEVVENDVIYID